MAIQIDVSGFNDRGIQRVLREVDFEILVSALKGVEETTKTAFLRNMSTGVATKVKEDLDSQDAVDETEVEVAVRKIHGIIEGLIEAGEIIRGKSEPVSKPSSPGSLNIDTSSVGSLRETIFLLSAQAQEQGLLSLEAAIADSDKDFLSMAIQLIVDGTDPKLVEMVLRRGTESFEQLERIKIMEETYRMERSLNEALTKKKMITEGVLSIQRGDNRGMLETILDMF